MEESSFCNMSINLRGKGLEPPLAPTLPGELGVNTGEVVVVVVVIVVGAELTVVTLLGLLLSAGESKGPIVAGVPTTPLAGVTIPMELVRVMRRVVMV